MTTVMVAKWLPNFIIPSVFITWLFIVWENLILSLLIYSCIYLYHYEFLLSVIAYNLFLSLLLFFTGAGSSGRQLTSPLPPNSEAPARELPLDGPAPEPCFTGTLLYWNLVSSELDAEVPCVTVPVCVFILMSPGLESAWK